MYIEWNNAEQNFALQNVILIHVAFEKVVFAKTGMWQWVTGLSKNVFLYLSRCKRAGMWKEKG